MSRDPAAEATAAAYEAVPYPGDAFLRTHPRHIAAIARLHGLALPSIERWRVLDLGCADGGNALAIAASLPGAEVVGVDLEPGAIGRGAALAAEAGVTNVRLLAADLMLLSPEKLGSFDLVIAHGLLSWVPDMVRRRALDLMRTVLRPHTGIGFVSINDGDVRTRLRERLLPPLADLTGQQRIDHARELLADDALGGEDPALQRHVAALRNAPDHLLAHDDLGAINTPLTQAQVQHESGLHVLADAGLTPYDTNASHRQLLLSRGRRLHPLPDPQLLYGLHAAAMLTHEPDGAFVTPDGGRIRTQFAPLNDALAELVRVWPRAHPVADLPVAAGPALVEAAGHGIVKLVTPPPVVTGSPGRRPRTLPLARAQAARDGRAVSQWHRTILLGPEERALIARLDGEQEVAAGDPVLARLAAAGLIVA